jgi:hypothetical protein
MVMSVNPVVKAICRTGISQLGSRDHAPKKAGVGVSGTRGLTAALPSASMFTYENFDARVFGQQPGRG